MNDFTAGRKPVRFKTWRGILLGANKHSTTQVHSRGGQNGRPVIVTSSNTLHLQFFVRPHDGGPDGPVQVNNADVPVMDGQDVTVVAGFLEGQDSGSWLRVINHHAQRVWPMADTLAVPCGRYGLGAWVLGYLSNGLCAAHQPPARQHARDQGLGAAGRRGAGAEHRNAGGAHEPGALKAARRAGAGGGD